MIGRDAYMVVDIDSKATIDGSICETGPWSSMHIAYTDNTMTNYKSKKEWWVQAQCL